MEKVITTERLPVKLWLQDIEEGALEQAKDLANLPFAFRHIAIMPDSHQGYGMPIGGVLAAERAIIPNAVGVDIGCGMCSLRTNLEEVDTDNLKKIMCVVRETVPVGFNHQSEKQDAKWMPKSDKSLPIVEQEYEKAMYQVGTLGGGNHFIEIQKGSDGFIWIMIHSGSRNIGYTVAKHYNEKAKEINELWFSTVPKDLSFFPVGTEEFTNYLNEMNYCIEFALSNRKLMMERVKNAFSNVIPNVEFSDFINKPHNFASWENHFGQNVIIHRKGATRAREGELGMIPGSQGTSSYIVKGKGNAESFESCSHGSGRVMSRTKARNTLSVEEETRRLDEMGVIHAIRSENDLDEAPSSYKDIKEVMGYQTDLVDIEIELKPLAVIKG
ncbi:MAG: RNA-splicing ligase RtcB [Balneola sp.]|nr:RNA-splicing ligase RtcB [Balneola sp.]|tara:strand:+ start:1861 stop:3015 length:1155 start_codon:yes stop_codon:yes gene_type:complete